HPDRVWIGRDDRARLIEWTDPGSGPIEEPSGSVGPTLASAQQLLYVTAVATLLGVRPDTAQTLQPATPLPRAARDMLLQLRDAQFSARDVPLPALGAPMAFPAYFSKLKRAGQIGVSAALPIVVTALTLFSGIAETANPATPKSELLFITFAVLSGTFVLPMFFAAIGAVVTGSGFTFRPFGAMLFNKRGKRASRVRALWRGIVTWSPVVVAVALFAAEPGRSNFRPSVFALQCTVMLGMAAAAVWAILHPSRSIQDRLSGTWIVPR